MSQSGYTPIQLYYSTTASNTPSTSNLKLGELAFNIADNKIYALNATSSGIQTVVGTLGNQNKNSVSITGGAIDGTTVGATTASTGAFTTLSASSTVSGTGFSAYLASPPAIGGTTANTITGTTITANTQFTGAGTGLTGTASSLSIGGAAPAGSLSGTTLNSTVINSSLTSVGTLTTGTWNATTIALAHGGTGATTASDAQTNLGLGTIATQAASSVAITGGSVDGTTIGATTASTGKFTSLNYNFGVGSGYGLNIQESGTFTDNSTHSFSSRGAACGVAYITSGNGITAIPWFPNGGGGVGYEFTILKPDAGTWTYGNTVTFTSIGSTANSYSFTVSNGAGQPQITRTSGSNSYTVYIAILSS